MGEENTKTSPHTPARSRCGCHQQGEGSSVQLSDSSSSSFLTFLFVRRPTLGSQQFLFTYYTHSHTHTHAHTGASLGLKLAPLTAERAAGHLMMDCVLGWQQTGLQSFYNHYKPIILPSNSDSHHNNSFHSDIRLMQLRYIRDVK